MVKIRLARHGRKGRPFYRIVVANSTSPRDGKFKEVVGTYDPMLKTELKDKVFFVTERVRHWLSVGAQATDRVKILMAKANFS